MGVLKLTYKKATPLFKWQLCNFSWVKWNSTFKHNLFYRWENKQFWMYAYWKLNSQNKIDTSLQPVRYVNLKLLSKILNIYLVRFVKTLFSLAMFYVNHKVYVFHLNPLVLQRIFGNIRCIKVKWCLFGYFWWFQIYCILFDNIMFYNFFTYS